MYKQMRNNVTQTGRYLLIFSSFESGSVSQLYFNDSPPPGILWQIATNAGRGLLKLWPRYNKKSPHKSRDFYWLVH